MDKLTIINRALGATGNNRLNQLADPDFLNEWMAANAALERAIDDLTSRHHWPFATKTVDLVLAPDGDNPSELYPYAYALPPDCFHLRRVLYTVAGATCPYPLTEGYELVGRYICARYSSGISAICNFLPADVQWHPQAAEIVTLYTEVGILREFNEDNQEARSRLAEAEARLAEGRSTISQENPAQNLYLSSISRARRTRRR